MGRGGRREGAGGKPTWNNGKTKVIRVPEVLAKKILEIARFLDTQSSFDSVILSENDAVTESKIAIIEPSLSKIVDLSGIRICTFRDGPGIYLADLVRAGYEIKPERLQISVKQRLERDKAKKTESKIDKANGELTASKHE